MIDFYGRTDIPCFGVAGNFTGHLEQAGEAADFASISTSDENAPKAVFPTYIPDVPYEPHGEGSAHTPDFLHTFPFSAEKIIYPAGEAKVQVEPECAIIFEAGWEGSQLVSLKPVCFGASNDCSIRKAGAKKISEKKNWGKCSKGFSANLIPCEHFKMPSEFDRYRIASFIVREGEIFVYGEDSAVRSYSYFYEKLESWLLEKCNFQRDEGPAENIHSYLVECGQPKQIMFSVGATRYTAWGESHFLQDGDVSAVVLYPEDLYSADGLKELVLQSVLAKSQITKTGISALIQTVQI